MTSSAQQRTCLTNIRESGELPPLRGNRKKLGREIVPFSLYGEELLGA